MDTTRYFSLRAASGYGFLFRKIRQREDSVERAVSRVLRLSKLPLQAYCRGHDGRHYRRMPSRFLDGVAQAGAHSHQDFARKRDGAHAQGFRDGSLPPFYIYDGYFLDEQHAAWPRTGAPPIFAISAVPRPPDAPYCR